MAMLLRSVSSEPLLEPNALAAPYLPDERATERDGRSLAADERRRRMASPPKHPAV